MRRSGLTQAMHLRWPMHQLRVLQATHSTHWAELTQPRAHRPTYSAVQVCMPFWVVRESMLGDVSSSPADCFEWRARPYRVCCLGTDGVMYAFAHHCMHDGCADAEFEGNNCPGLEPQYALAQSADAPADYDPTQVDWRSLVKAVEFVAAKEKRYCNFAIRAHFHDAGSLGKDAPAPATVYGADGSLMLDKFECAPRASNLPPSPASRAAVRSARNRATHVVHQQLTAPVRNAQCKSGDFLQVWRFHSLRFDLRRVVRRHSCEMLQVPAA